MVLQDDLDYFPITQDESADRVMWETEAYDLLPKPTTGTASSKVRLVATLAMQYPH